MASIRDLYAELVDIDMAEAKRVLVPMYQSNTGGGVGSFSYKVPAPYKLAIMGIRAHVVLLSSATEPLAIGNLTPMANVSEHIAAKAMNCRVRLQNQDTNVYILGEGNQVNLVTLLEGAAGGKAVDWRDAPQIVTMGQTLLMEYSLIQTIAGLTDIATEYGIVLDALLVRARGDR